MYTLDETYTELYQNMDLKQLFTYISQGKNVVMTQELSGTQGNASKDTCCIVTDNDISGFQDADARLNLNGYKLQYNFDSNANKDWTIFDIQAGSSLTITGGITHGGTLVMDLTALNSNASPTLFHLESGGKLILEKGTVIEMVYAAGISDAAKQVSMFSIGGQQFVLKQSDYPYLKYEHDTENRIKRITVLETTTIVGE